MNDELSGETGNGGASIADKTVLVAGLGVSGRSMVEVLKGRAKSVISVDEHKPEADLHSFDDIDWDRIDLVMTSPVFTPRTPFILEAQPGGYGSIPAVPAARRRGSASPVLTEKLQPPK